MKLIIILTVIGLAASGCMQAIGEKTTAYYETGEIAAVNIYVKVNTLFKDFDIDSIQIGGLDVNDYASKSQQLRAITGAGAIETKTGEVKE